MSFFAGLFLMGGSTCANAVQLAPGLAWGHEPRSAAMEAAARSLAGSSADIAGFAADHSSDQHCTRKYLSSNSAQGVPTG